MATKGISEAFAKYGARLKNVNWSVSAWNSTGELVLSLWAHHYRKGEDGSAEYSGKLSRWAGPGNNEFRANISDAFERKSSVRLVVVQTPLAGQNPPPLATSNSPTPDRLAAL